MNWAQRSRASNTFSGPHRGCQHPQLPNLTVSEDVKKEVAQVRELSKLNLTLVPLLRTRHGCSAPGTRPRASRGANKGVFWGCSCIGFGARSVSESCPVPAKTQPHHAGGTQNVTFPPVVAPDLLWLCSSLCARPRKVPEGLNKTLSVCTAHVMPFKSCVGYSCLLLDLIFLFFFFFNSRAAL